MACDGLLGLDAPIESCGRPQAYGQRTGRSLKQETVPGDLQNTITDLPRILPQQLAPNLLNTDAKLMGVVGQGGQRELRLREPLKSREC